MAERFRRPHHIRPVLLSTVPFDVLLHENDRRLAQSSQTGSHRCCRQITAIDGACASEYLQNLVNRILLLRIVLVVESNLLPAL